MPDFVRTEVIAAQYFSTAKRPVAAARKWLKRHGVPAERLGPRLLLWDLRVIQKMKEAL